VEYLFAPKVIKQLRKIKNKNPKLFAKIEKQLIFFKEDHRYPSLRTHKLKGELSDSWSISVAGDFRMFYFLKGDQAVFFIAGTHFEVYEKK
jgi:addiction module RelE/StbE family toxin